eukprot:COSAG04_NODE_966_length_9138_cov_6.958624_3_plen_78_part_00
MNVAHVSCAYNAEAILAWALELEPSLVGMEDKVGRLPLHWCKQTRTISLTAEEISFGTHTDGQDKIRPRLMTVMTGF